MLNASKIMILAAAGMGLGAFVLGDAAAATYIVRHHHRVRHRVVVRAPGPVVVAPAAPIDALDLPHPIVRDPLDDGDSVGVAAGQGPSLLGPDSDARIAAVPRGRSFEIEAPPIGASLPVVPELYDPDLR